jgi:hypothetical protein
LSSRTRASWYWVGVALYAEANQPSATAAIAASRRSDPSCRTRPGGPVRAAAAHGRALCQAREGVNISPPRRGDAPLAARWWWPGPCRRPRR